LISSLTNVRFLPRATANHTALTVSQPSDVTSGDSTSNPRFKRNVTTRADTDSGTFSSLHCAEQARCNRFRPIRSVTLRSDGLSSKSFLIDSRSSFRTASIMRVLDMTLISAQRVNAMCFTTFESTFAWLNFQASTLERAVPPLWFPAERQLRRSSLRVVQAFFG
jgi:hypothetical protein